MSIPAIKMHTKCVERHYSKDPPCKYRYGTEVHFYLEELLALLIGLDNHFDDKDFNELKLNNMVAVIVTNLALPRLCLICY